MLKWVAKGTLKFLTSKHSALHSTKWVEPEKARAFPFNNPISHEIRQLHKWVPPKSRSIRHPTNKTDKLPLHKITGHDLNEILDCRTII